MGQMLVWHSDVSGVNPSCLEAEVVCTLSIQNQFRAANTVTMKNDRYCVCLHKSTDPLPITIICIWFKNTDTDHRWVCETSSVIVSALPLLWTEHENVFLVELKPAMCARHELPGQNCPPPFPSSRRFAPLRPPGAPNTN